MLKFLNIAPDSAAALAGLRIHEVIIEANGQHIRSTEDLAAVLAQNAASSEITLGYLCKSNLGWMRAEAVVVLPKKD